MVKFYNIWEFPIPVHTDEYLKSMYGGKTALKVPRILGFKTAPKMFHEVADPANLPTLLRPYEACTENKFWCSLFKEAEMLSEQRQHFIYYLPFFGSLYSPFLYNTQPPWVK